MAQPAVKESSGLAVGLDGTVWAHSDGPNVGERSQDRKLYALSRDGSVLRVATLNVRNNDWEDMAAFTQDGKRYLLVADVGDNLEHRSESQIYVTEEPLGQNAVVAWRIRFRYPDRPHDCEAVAVDVENKRVLLVTKRDSIPQIFQLDLKSNASVQTATLVGSLWAIPKVPVWTALRHPLLAPYAHQPTGMDISSDNRKAVVLTYNGAYVWRREPAATWEQTLGREPDHYIALPGLRQYEGVTFAHENESLLVSEEGQDGLHAVSIPDK
jgi:hypothetical protein